MSKGSLNLQECLNIVAIFEDGIQMKRNPDSRPVGEVLDLAWEELSTLVNFKQKMKNYPVEGKVKRGGVGNPPTCPKPEAYPKGQHGSTSKEQTELLSQALVIIELMYATADNLPKHKMESLKTFLTKAYKILEIPEPEKE